MTLLSLQNISVSFNKRNILTDLSLELNDDRFISISGKSGSGKTTMLSVISGLLKPDSGKVMYKDKNIYKWSDRKRSKYRNRKIGYIFQSFNLLSELSVFQNVVYSASLNPASKKINERTNDLLDQLGIWTIRNRKPHEISGGEKQRTAIARALINSPDFILADEPTGNLDSDTSEAILKLFRDIQHKYGIYFLIATHDRNIIKKSDAHYALENGVLKKKSR